MVWLSPFHLIVIVASWPRHPTARERAQRRRGEKMTRQPRHMATRRGVIRAGGLLGIGSTGLFTPAISHAADWPYLTHGLQSGDVTADSAIVWARASQPSRLRIEFATTESFASIIGGVYVDA